MALPSLGPFLVIFYPLSWPSVLICHGFFDNVPSTYASPPRVERIPIIIDKIKTLDHVGGRYLATPLHMIIQSMVFAICYLVLM